MSTIEQKPLNGAVALTYFFLGKTEKARHELELGFNHRTHGSLHRLKNDYQLVENLGFSPHQSVIFDHYFSSYLLNKIAGEYKRSFNSPYFMHVSRLPFFSRLVSFGDFLIDTAEQKAAHLAKQAQDLSKCYQDPSHPLRSSIDSPISVQTAANILTNVWLENERSANGYYSPKNPVIIEVIDHIKHRH